MKHLLRKYYGQFIFTSVLFSFLFSLTPFSSSAYFITDLKAACRNGQVFLTWKSPFALNLKYNVYRSENKLVSEFKLNANTYVGSVRDSSSKNIRRSRIDQKDIFFKIDEGADPLTGNLGLYVTTCADEGAYYYAVTVTNLSTGIEANKLTLGKNSMSEPVQEHIADPQPVWQDSLIWPGGDVVQMYVQFVNNKELPHCPAMTNEGSYGYNFYLLKRGHADISPLYVFYEGIKNNSLIGNGLDDFSSVANCYVMGLDDWIPFPNGYSEESGKNTFWCGYHEEYDIYSSHNPVQVTGTVKTFTQKRLIHSILWGRKYLPVDTTEVYLVGRSSGGYGILLTANLIPDKIAAVYAIVEPDKMVSYSDWTSAMWGTRDANLNSDIMDPNTGQYIPIFDFMNLNYMIEVNKNRSLPVVYCINGKNDHTVGWKEIPGFFESLQSNHIGGCFFWDQREHNGEGSNFLDSETMPDFELYHTNQSYPAFSNCSVNPDPGNGKKNDGDLYGAINGYLTWLNSSITDEECNYDVKVKIADFYVGGITDAQQHNFAFADVTFRRLQQFKPQIGQEVKWKNYDSTNQKIQNGSFTFSGNPITLSGIHIDKAGNRLELKISDCDRKQGKNAREVQLSETTFQVFKSGQGWSVNIGSQSEEDVELRVFNIHGQLLSRKSIHLYEGTNSISIPAPRTGLFFVELKGHSMAAVKMVEF